MIEALTIINTIAIIGLILQILMLKQEKPKMNHLTKWMQKQEAINKKLIYEIEYQNKKQEVKNV